MQGSAAPRGVFHLSTAQLQGTLVEAGGGGSAFQERRGVTREAEVRAAEHSNSLWRVLLSRGSYGRAGEPACWGRTAREVG